jgi:cytochrome c-type biogenesis protein
MDLSATLAAAMNGGTFVALPLALAGGVLAALNPCCVALYPAAAGACCSSPGCEIRRPVGNAFAFILGMASAVAVLGFLAVVIGRVAGLSTPFRTVVALVPIIMGLSRLGWIKFPDWTPHIANTGMRGAFGAGLLLSLVIGPCGTPVLASVLSYAALSHSLVYGTVLLFVYGLGTGVPVLAVGSTSGSLLARFGTGAWSKWIDPVIGAMLIALGFFMLWRA